MVLPKELWFTVWIYYLLENHKSYTQLFDIKLRLFLYYSYTLCMDFAILNSLPLR